MPTTESPDIIVPEVIYRLPAYQTTLTETSLRGLS
jgi:hypothetical protein